MLRRPPTVLTLTNDDIANYETNRVDRLRRAAQLSRAKQRAQQEATLARKRQREEQQAREAEIDNSDDVPNHNAQRQLPRQDQTSRTSAITSRQIREQNHHRYHEQMQMQIDAQEGDTEPDEDEEDEEEDEKVDIDYRVEQMEGLDASESKVAQQVLRGAHGSTIAGIAPVGSRRPVARQQRHPQTRPRPRPSMPPDEDNPFVSNTSGTTSSMIAGPRGMSQQQQHALPVPSRPENTMRFPQAPPLHRSRARGGRLVEDGDADMDPTMEDEDDDETAELDTPTAASSFAAAARRGRGGQRPPDRGGGVVRAGMANVDGAMERQGMGGSAVSREREQRERERRERIMGAAASGSIRPGTGGTRLGGAGEGGFR